MYTQLFSVHSQLNTIIFRQEAEPLLSQQVTLSGQQ